MLRGAASDMSPSGASGFAGLSTPTLRKAKAPGSGPVDSDAKFKAGDFGPR
jgi:hypothetical protein